jgi:hypothetical protein
MSVSRDFTAEQGATWRRTVEYRNPDGTPFELVGWTARLEVRPRRGTATALLEGSAVVNGPAGTVTVSITADQTSALLPGRYFYDVDLVSPVGEVTRLIDGSIQVTR